MKQLINGFSHGLKFWGRSWPFIFRNQLFHYFLFPIVISTLLSMGSAVAIIGMVRFLTNRFSPFPVSENFTGIFSENTISIFSEISTYASRFVWALLLWYLFLRIKKYVVLALMSPVMSRLSEKTDALLTGKIFAFNQRKFISDIMRALALSLRNLILEVLINMIIWFAVFYLTLIAPFLIFVLVPFGAVLTFILGSYFYGFALADYTHERHNLEIRLSIRMIRNNRYETIGNGMIFSLLFLIPFIGISIATITCTVASTMSAIERNLLNSPNE